MTGFLKLLNCGVLAAACVSGVAAESMVLSHCQLMNVFLVGTEASGSNGADFSCQ